MLNNNFILVACSAFPIVANAESSSSGPFNEGDEITYTCLQGYQLVGVSTLVCQNTGIFLPNPPTCVAGRL